MKLSATHDDLQDQVMPDEGGEDALPSSLMENSLKWVIDNKNKAAESLKQNRRSNNFFPLKDHFWCQNHKVSTRTTQKQSAECSAAYDERLCDDERGKATT